jgi:lysophospholipase L1-like esterase
MYSDTWIAMLRQCHLDSEFITNFYREATTDILSAWDYGEHLSFYNPDCIIIQLGICDCAPRYIPNRSFLYKVLNNIPKKLSDLLWIIIKFMSNRSIRYANVLPNKFEKNIVSYLDKCVEYNVKNVIIIKIARPTNVMLKLNPSINDAIDIYNNILDQISQHYDFVKIIDPLNEPDEKYYTNDGYHPSFEGNQKVAKYISNIIMGGGGG